MCVLKHTRWICFDTLPFYTLVLSPLAYHPVGRPHFSCLKCSAARVALHSIKNPGCLVQGLVEFVSYFLCVTCTFNRPCHPWNTIHATWGVWPGKCCLEHRGFCRQWTECCFHHKSYCTVFSDCCQPLNDFFFQSYLCLAAELVARDGIAPPVPRLWAWWDTTSPPRVIKLQLFIPGVPGWIQTSGFRDLQSLALGHSATETFPYM